MCFLEFHTCAGWTRQTHTLTYIYPSTVLFHSAQKSCQEATWEFPETEIELVLTQAEQKAVAGTWIIVPYKVLTARRTLRHVCHHVSSLQRCLKIVTPGGLILIICESRMRNILCTRLYRFYNIFLVIGLVFTNIVTLQTFESCCHQLLREQTHYWPSLLVRFEHDALLL